MSLSTKLAGNFTKNVRKRGDDYYCSAICLEKQQACGLV